MIITTTTNGHYFVAELVDAPKPLDLLCGKVRRISVHSYRAAWLLAEALCGKGRFWFTMLRRSEFKVEAMDFTMKSMKDMKGKE